MIWFYDAIASIRDFLDLGGDVLYGIMLTLFLMWTFILERMWYFYRVHPGERSRIIEDWESRADTASWHAKRIREQMISQTNVALKRNIGLIKALIAICVDRLQSFQRGPFACRENALALFGLDRRNSMVDGRR